MVLWVPASPKEQFHVLADSRKRLALAAMVAVTRSWHCHEREVKKRGPHTLPHARDSATSVC